MWQAALVEKEMLWKLAMIDPKSHWIFFVGKKKSNIFP